jgi:ABC-type amino acid transport substrate-binding protein
MKTALRLIPLGLAAALALTGCASSSSPAASNAATGGGSAASTAATGAVALVDAGKLTVCTNPPYEPFEFNDASGNVVGLDIDIVGEVAKDLGVELATKVTPFEGIQSGADLNTGNCDVVASGITITADRKAKIDFSDPYFNADQGLLVPEDSDLKDAASLKGKNVGVQQATTGETWAKDNGLDAAQDRPGRRRDQRCRGARAVRQPGLQGCGELLDGRAVRLRREAGERRAAHGDQRDPRSHPRGRHLRHDLHRAHRYCTHGQLTWP